MLEIFQPKSVPHKGWRRWWYNTKRYFIQTWRVLRYGKNWRDNARMARPVTPEGNALYEALKRQSILERNRKKLLHLKQRHG